MRRHVFPPRVPREKGMGDGLAAAQSSAGLCEAEEPRVFTRCSVWDPAVVSSSLARLSRRGEAAGVRLLAAMLTAASPGAESSWLPHDLG